MKPKIKQKTTYLGLKVFAFDKSCFIFNGPMDGAGLSREAPSLPLKLGAVLDSCPIICCRKTILTGCAGSEIGLGGGLPHFPLPYWANWPERVRLDLNKDFIIRTLSTL